MKLVDNTEIPNICPCCHVANNPNKVSAARTISELGESQVIILWRCTNDECERAYPVLYDHNGGYYEFRRFLMGTPEGPSWPKPIADLKSGREDDIDRQSRFIDTYLQSLQAEMDGLDEIAGMGFRKSIEYLVKDWAIQENPDSEENINELWLSAVIQKFYSDDLKAILERATWLGNDQSHYNKLFEEYDISDLKELIALIMVELDRQFKMKHYIENIQKRK